MPTVLWVLTAALAGLILGKFFGMRLQLARGRFRELRRGIAQMQNESSLERAFVETLRKRREFEATGRVHHARVINVTQFLLTWNWDLSILLDLLRTAPEAWSIETAWRRKLLARTVALVAYETLTKLEWTVDPTKSDRKTSLWRPLRALGLGEVLSEHVLGLHRDITAVLTEHGELLGGIRDNIIGHRDNDVAKQLLWMRKADAKEIEALGWELLALTNKALGTLSAIVTAIGAQPLPATSSRPAT